MSRGLPGRDRRTRRVVLPRPLVEPHPHGNREARRAWERQNGRSAPQAAFAPEDTRDGQTAAHGPAGRHDGHSTDDTTEEQTSHG